MQQLTITRPDDWHLHLRDDAFMQAVLPDTARQFARAIVMPNLKPPITTTVQAQAYRTRIIAALPIGAKFEPLMTLYLTDNTTAEEIKRAKQSGIIHAVKYYPAGATTNSDAGVTDIRKTYPALEEMQRCGMPLLVHGEVTDKNVDVFDREEVFIERVMIPLLRDLPQLRVVFEHITTRDAVQFVAGAANHIAATITAHHLLYNRNAMFSGGMRPHYYCLPVLKREAHREALGKAAISGNPKFFLGTDSAPHAQHAKETACGCAGCYTAHAAIELYAEAFEQLVALDKLEAFASFYGADYYHLPRNTDRIILRKENWRMPDNIPFADHKLIPLRAGENMLGRLVADMDVTEGRPAVLRAKLNLETGQIHWKELQSFFASGAVLVISVDLDLVEVAFQMSEDNFAQIQQWAEAGKFCKATDEQAATWFEADTQLWAVVVSPWVLVQQARPLQ